MGSNSSLSAEPCEAESHSDSNDENSCIPKIHENKFKYVWKIHNLNNPRTFINGEIVTSPTFSSGTNDAIKWCLEIQPKKRDNPETVHLATTSVRLLSSNLSVVTTKCELSISAEDVPDENKYAHYSFIKNFDLDECNVRCVPTPVSIHSSGMVKDTLVVYCTISIFSDINDSEETKIRSPECGLSTDMGFLFNNKEWSDVTISIDNEVDFKAHKAILAARSSVFRNMFKQEKSEKNIDQIYIIDTEQEVLREVLRFIYTGRVQDIEDIAADVLIAAHKYDLPRLKQICEKMLCAGLSVHNASFILSLSDLHNAPQLKDHAMNFIKQNIRRVVNTQGFMLMFKMHMNLIEEIVYSGDEMDKINVAKELMSLMNIKAPYRFAQ